MQKMQKENLKTKHKMVQFTFQLHTKSRFIILIVLWDTIQVGLFALCMQMTVTQSENGHFYKFIAFFSSAKDFL